MRPKAKKPPAPRRGSRSQAGFALIEVVVSAVVVVIVGGGALAAVQSANRSGAEERHRAKAYGIAQEDQARMRSMRISALSNLNETRTVTEDGTPYTVTSAGEFVTDSTGTANCNTGSASADYIRITSSVSWPSMGARPPALLQSTVAPPNGSISEDHGALAVAVKNGQDQGLEGVGLTGSGAGSFSGSTGANGCAIFGNLPEGNYTLTPSGSGLVDKDGNAPQPLPTSVVALSTNTVVLQYDHPGSVDVSFTTNVGGTLVPSSADTVVVFNTGMTEAKVFGTPDSPAAIVTASPLFPFASPDTVYAGACTDHNPNPATAPDAPAAAAAASVVVPSGSSTTATVQLPALHLTVWSGLDAARPGSPVNNAQVKLTDQSCVSGGTPIVRSFRTNASGQLADPGLPTSVYDVCADDGTTMVTTNGVDLLNFADVADFDDGTTLDIYLGGGVPGTCVT